jgi:hypothetical protein
MKRRRRLFTPMTILRVQVIAYGGRVIPPRSVVIAREPVTVEAYGRESCRIGYYRRTDGLNCVWLVNSSGEYFGTADQKYIRENFEIVELSDETDVYGDERQILQPLASAA